MHSSSSRAANIALLGLFAVSGLAGLLYETIWAQYLGLFLGHAAYAQSFVLILFMGGMALGAWLVSRRSELLVRPLVAYAAAELIVGMLGIAFDPIYHAVTGFAYSRVFPLVGSGYLLDASRYAICAALIGPQCVLLGTTFPLMSAGYLRRTPVEGGQVLAGLYFSNSFGAAIGALAATFALLPAVGLPGTVMAGGMLSIVVAVLVWPMAKQPAAAVTSARSEAAGGLLPGFILLAAAITGATSFVYELTWVRMLAQALGSTLHAFELMLAAFISGIAFGGLWLRRRADRLPDALLAAGWAQVLMGLAALGSLFVYARSFDWIAALVNGLARNDEGYAFFNVASGAIALAVMFPAAFFAGMTLPLLTLALLRRGSGERAIGRVYAANTLGAIVGVLLTLHVLMPSLGVRLGLWLAALVDLALGLYLIARSADGAMRARALVVGGVVSVALAIGAVAWTRVDPLTLASSVYRSGRPRLPDGTDMLYYADGKTATVALFQYPGPSKIRSIATNGKPDASIATDPAARPALDEYTMAFLAALPLAYRPQIEDAAVIGFGSGMTVHTLLGSDTLRSVDVVEIEPEMVAAARGFGPRVGRAFADPRVRVAYDDAKAYMAGSSKRYDVIVSEPSNPWVNGVATLFSDEFYAFVPRHLNRDGIFVQWVQLYEITPELVASILKAMLPHFHDVKAYTTNSSDMLLVASADGDLPGLSDIGGASAQLRAELQRMSVHGPDDWRRFALLDRRGLEALARMAPTPTNSDMFPYVQLHAPKARFTHTTASDIVGLQGGVWPLAEVAMALPQPSGSASASAGLLAGDIGRQQALDIKATLLSGQPVGSADPDTMRQVLTVRSLARDCATDLAVDVWIEASAAIAGATISHLDAEELKGVWIQPAWPASCAAKDPRVARVLAYYAALSARDWAETARIGSELFDGDLDRVPSFKAFALGATDLANFALGRYGAMADLERAHGVDVKQYAFERRWLAALSFVSNARSRVP